MAPTVTITGVGTGITVTCLLGDQPPRTSGYARWRLENRPRREPLTVFDGMDALTLVLAVLLDKWPGGSVEGDILRLEGLTTPAVDGGEPPVVRVTGPIPHANLSWVITDLQFGDVLYNKRRQRSRQAVAITLTRYIASDRVRPRVVKAGAVARTVRAKKGDTPTSIAVREYANATLWLAIADLNGKGWKRTQKLAAGTLVKLPSVTTTRVSGSTVGVGERLG